MSYSLPHTELNFRRAGDGYRARFRMRAECRDNRGIPRATRDWLYEVQLSDYDATMLANRKVLGSESLFVRYQPLVLRITLEDLQSEQEWDWERTLESPGPLSDLWLPGLDSERKPDGDTLTVWIEVYPRLAASTGHYVTTGSGNDGETAKRSVDGLEIVITRERKELARRWLTVPPDSWRVREVLTFPLTDYGSGEYQVIARLIGDRRVRAERQASFRIQGSFFASERTYQERVRQLIWVATQAEIQRLLAAPVAARESLWNAFWRERDQTPTTVENEAERIYFERIDYCEQHFRHGDKGYRSDRARVYVKYGPPDYIESLPFEREANAYEKWYYYGLNLTFVFYDVSGFGEFRQIEPARW